MNNHSQFYRLATTFVVVFLAVGAALGADSWRQALLDSRNHDILVDRLMSDLNLGVDQLELDRRRTIAAYEAAARLIAALEKSHPHRSEHEMLQDFITAARTGFYDFQLVHNATFRQLHDSGSLGNVVASELEVALIEYYEYVGLIKSLWARTPQSINKRFHRLVGLPPITVRDAAELSSVSKQQLLDVMVKDSEILEDLRELRAMLSILVLNDVFQRAIDSSHDLADKLGAVNG